MWSQTLISKLRRLNDSDSFLRKMDKCDFRTTHTFTGVMNSNYEWWQKTIYFRISTPTNQVNLCPSTMHCHSHHHYFFSCRCSPFRSVVFLCSLWQGWDGTASSDKHNLTELHYRIVTNTITAGSIHLSYESFTRPLVLPLFSLMCQKYFQS
jgi:predicted NodU family carbamoyl transferase